MDSSRDDHAPCQTTIDRLARELADTRRELAEAREELLCALRRIERWRNLARMIHRAAHPEG